MGHWGVASYENDDAADALDAGFDQVHGALYEELMDDDNELSFEEVLQKLADPRTLDAALKFLTDQFGPDPDDWEDVGKLAMVGVVVRHAELGVPIPDPWKGRALAWLKDEPIEWDDATLRKLRRAKEAELVSSGKPSRKPGRPQP